MNDAEKTTFPPRLHVLLASKAPVGLVIRRGPSKQVATILWNRVTDEFTLGQWLKGRIYERRSDLSPDGKLFLYFAMNGKWKTETHGSWTAISRTPHLKAIALFAKGDCWHGGGLWTGDDKYWLNDGYGHTELRNTSAARREKKFKPSEYYGGECPGVYYHRLIRDGWRMIEFVRANKNDEQTIFEKPAPRDWTLRKIAHAGGPKPGKGGCYWDQHELIHPKLGTLALPDSQWADVDGDRLVWATDGKLFAARLSTNGLAEETELQDFSDMKFEANKAPY